MRLHAYHGVLTQEREVGNDYVVNLTVDYPIMSACLSDNVADTMSYAAAAAIINREMETPSCLLENVAYRICIAILHQFTKAAGVTVSIQKTAPPMPADCDGAGITLQLSRKDIREQ